MDDVRKILPLKSSTLPCGLWNVYVILSTRPLHSTESGIMISSCLNGLIDE